MRRLVLFYVAILMLLLCGCSEKELPGKVVTITEENILQENVEGEAYKIWNRTATGLYPNGDIRIYLEGENAEKRLEQIGTVCARTPEICDSFDYNYIGVYEQGGGYCLKLSIENKNVILNDFVRAIQEHAVDDDFNKDGGSIEIVLCQPPFIDTEEEMRENLASFAFFDEFCHNTGNFDEDGYVHSKEKANEMAARFASYGGYSTNHSEMSADSMRMAVAGDEDAFISGWNWNATKHVPTFLAYLPANIGCDKIEGISKGSNLTILKHEDVRAKYLTRGSSMLNGIFGQQVLTFVFQAGLDEIENQFGDMGTDRMIQTNWKMVLMDCHGNFRVRFSLMVKEPEGKEGWHIGAYEAVVKPIGDMFTSAKYEATGEIITIRPLTSFQNAIDAYKKVQEDSQRNYALNPVDVVHAFSQEGKIDELKVLYPYIMQKHDIECDAANCNYQ